MKSNYHTLLQQHFQASSGIVKMEELRKAGIPLYTIRSFIHQGILKRIRHGYYTLPETHDFLSDEEQIRRLIPQAIVCMESAAFHYGYSDFVPREWSLAVPRTISRARLRLRQIPTKAYYVTSRVYELGKTIDDFNGTSLSVTDRERTICDVYRYRNRFDSDFFNKALIAYASDPQKNIQTLLSYSKELRLDSHFQAFMGVLIHE